MSNTSQGHGWWLASDGKWYPPEAWTGPPPPPPQMVAPNPYLPGQPSYPTGPSMPQGVGWVPVPATRTNGLAVASLICSCVGIIPFFFGLPCVLGIIFGFVSRGRIKRAQGTLGGSGLALAGIIVGFSLIGIFILFLILLAAFGNVKN
jgi:hypothetical protein